MSTKIGATIEDLYNVPDDDKAEIVNGELVSMSPTGGLPGYAAGEIYSSLRDYAKRTKSGYVFPDNVGFVVNLTNRRSFSPDAAFYNGELTMQFLEGAPIFAAEVRSAGDYGQPAEPEMAEKRRDYFKAGTLVAWDVDLTGPDIVRVYRAENPAAPTIDRRGAVAEAESALPGWQMTVDELFA